MRRGPSDFLPDKILLFREIIANVKKACEDVPEPPPRPISLCALVELAIHIYSSQSHQSAEITLTLQ